MNKTALASKIQSVAALTGEFLLRSGDTSTQYFDKYRFESPPKMLAEVVIGLAELLPESFDKLAGLELGGVPLATVLSLKTGRSCLFVRKKAKEHGTRNIIEGGFESGGRVVIVEDVVTSGGAVIEAIDHLREVGLIVEHVICVIDRESKGREAIEAKECSFDALFTRTELNSVS